MADAAYLVARGVRPLAIVGERIADEIGMIRAMTLLDPYSSDTAIPFVVDHMDGTASWGYAAAAWAIDLYRWVRLEETDESRRHQILGLLLGYSPEAIARHLDSLVGRLFTRSGGSGSSQQVACTLRTEGKSRPCSEQSPPGESRSLDRSPILGTSFQ